MRTLTMTRISPAERLYKKVGRCLGCRARFVIGVTPSRLYCPSCFPKVIQRVDGGAEQY